MNNHTSTFYDVICTSTPEQLSVSVRCHPHLFPYGDAFVDPNGRFCQTMRQPDHIIQIMPAVTGTTSNYDATLGGEPFSLPVVAWGLTVSGDVVAVDISDDGELAQVDIFTKNYVGFTIPTVGGNDGE